MNDFENKLDAGDKKLLAGLDSFHVSISLFCYLTYVGCSSENLWKSLYLNLINTDDVTLDRNGTMDQCITN